MTVSTQTTDRSASRASARRFATVLATDVPLLVVFAAFVAASQTRDFALVNLLVQGVLFGLVACRLALRTRRMAVVDGIWPWGLVALGIQALLFGDTGSPTLVVVAAIYIVMGLRGGIWAVVLGIKKPLREELPRYRYRRLVWQREGYRSETAPMLHEILQQGFCNVSILAAPAMLAVADGHAGFGPAAIAGTAVWAVSWTLESLADLQKARFGRAGGTRTCEAGLWRYSRHPNYFFQWLQWFGLIALAAPPLAHLRGHMAVLPWAGFVAALVAIVAGMYYVLVYYTGAIPAEYFSVQHRPDYREYQRRVNRFVPGPPRRA